MEPAEIVPALETVAPAATKLAMVPVFATEPALAVEINGEIKLVWLGKAQICKGLEIALKKMQVGEVRIVSVPAKELKLYG
jgi:FKBP-type peptidyl-prolyl cis-trans isomerase 2